MSNIATPQNPNPALGPFTKETFAQQKWKHIKDKIYLLNSTNEEETLPEVRTFYQFLLELNASPDYNQYFGDASIKKYFFEEFFAANAKNLICCKYFNNAELLELSNNCFHQMILFWLKAFNEDHPKLAEMAKVILDPTRTYYKFNNQENVSSSTVPGFLEDPTPEHLEWINGLKKGDLVDCIKVDQTYKKMIWSHAKVALVMESSLKVYFLNDHEKTCRYIEKKTNAHELAPYKTKCHDFDWRLNIQENDEVDACDTSHVWYNSTVLATRTLPSDDGNSIKELYIGYRVYSEEGDRMDGEGRRFFGWSTKYDEWISATDARIAQKNSMAKKLHMGSSSNTDDPVVDDSNDRVYTDESGKKIYAIIRSGYCKSIFLINLVNDFGRLGGFDKVYERISNPVGWAPIETVSSLISIVGGLGTILHRDFALEYIPKLKDAVWKNLLESPESNIRNFTKDKIEAITGGFDVLLKRVVSLPEKQEMVETLNLQVCCVCFDTHFLERKLQGLKTLLQIMKDIRYNTGPQKFITNHQLNNFLRQNGIFNKIFGSKGHVELIKRSQDFLKYLLHEDILSVEDFQNIWSGSTKGDMETKLAVYKVLSDISLHLKAGHLDYLITKVSEIPPQDIIAEEIELVFEMCKFSIKPAWFIQKARDFYWQIISDDAGVYTSNIVDLTLAKFCDIMKGTDFKEERINVLYDCVNNISKGTSVLCSLKIMKRLIDHYPTSPASSEKYTKGTCVDHLCKEKDLLEVLIKNLKSFKADVTKKVENQKKVTEEALNTAAGERATYITHINDRLQFIHFLLSNNSSEDIKLTYELLSDLWDVIVNKALISSERDVLYKWIKEIAESKTGFPMSIEDLKRFFNEMMKGEKDESSQRMTKEGFKCFKNVFLVINEKLTKIAKVNVTSSSSNSSYSGYPGYYYSTAKKEENNKKKDDFTYRINVFPNELEGIENLWDFILVAEEDVVAEKAIDFLNKLYLHVSTELESKIIQIREEYLANCNQHLKATLDNQKSLSEVAFANRCQRCLGLINSIMDESEKLGIGNLKSHSGLVKGELLTIYVTNDVSTGNDVPKKTELRVYSNTTVFDLRVEIAKQFKATWDQVKLLRRYEPKEIRDNENGRTLREIRLKNGETLTAAKRPTPPIPQISLIQGDDTIHPLAKKIFTEWFEKFSEDGRMNPEQCAAFIHSCTNDNCKADDKRVKDVFASYDEDKKGFMTLENFLKFYGTASKQRPAIVWNNLHSHHYRNDLKKVTEVEQEKVDITALARYIISTNTEYFQLVFSLLDLGGKVATEAWKLLNRLPTSPQMFAEIVMLKGVRETSDPSQRDWNHILDSSSKYKLLYALHVIEYLMEDDEAETEEEEEGEKQMSRLLWAKDAKLIEYKKTWQADFIVYGGFEHLFKIFNVFAKQDSKKLTIFDKNILSFVLKILKNYLSAAFAATTPHIYRNLSFVRLFYLSLDFIQDYINSEHTRLSRENSLVAETELAKAQSKDGNKPKTDAEGAKTAAAGKTDTKAEEKKKEKLKIEEPEEFKALVERLRGELGPQILATVKLNDFIEIISSLGFNILTDTGDLESEDRMILEYSLSILMAIMLYNEEYIKYFLNPEKKAEGHQGADKYMLEGIFCHRMANIRKYFSHAIYVLCKNTQRYQNSFASKYFIGLFLNYLPSSNDDTKKDCNQYFELLCKLIEETYMNDKRPKSTQTVEQDSLDFKGLLGKVIERLREHTSTERRNNLNITDKILMGLLNLCEKIVTVQPQLRDSVGSTLVDEIFNVCLFNTSETNDDKNYVKCKSKDSRAIAYKLLIALCRDHDGNMLSLLQAMKNLTSTIVQVNTKSSWGYSPSNDTKSVYGYVGIKNLGCICYMNAMLQQFFMTPTFRYAMLAADDKKEPNWQKKDKLTVDDNVLHQLQKMFGFLELSDRQDYNPQEFCFAFKDHGGNPVNVSVQQDTQEFLNMIFDKLEIGLKQTPFQSILESVYGGKTSNQIICNGCGNINEREDIFYNLSVEVKNLKTVFESFDKFITGETIDDYYCDTCKKKNSITKRTCLSELPNVLIIHLQRIVFDLDTLMNQKINSKLEFPQQLNLEPYTKEGLEWREKSKKQKLDSKKKGETDASSGNKASEKGKSEATDRKEEDEVDIIDEDEEEYEVIDENEKDGSGKKAPRKTKKKDEIDEVLGPYMKHEKEHYEYKLAGVVVHVGTADFGHYYSYINTNRGDQKLEANAQKADKWLEYNDSLIKDFDVKDIENECFGGGAGGDSSDDYFSWGKASSREYSKNAYILVYERVTKDPLKLVVRNEDDREYLNNVLKMDQVSDKKDEVRVEKVEVGEGDNKQTIENYYCDFYRMDKYVSPTVYKSVWGDNHKFMFERHIYTEDFFKFFKEVCNTLKLPEEILHTQTVNSIYPKHTLLSPQVKENINGLTNILSVLIFYLLARAHDNNTITDLAEKLKQFLSLNPESAWQLFDTVVNQDVKNVLELLLNCPEKQVRACTSSVILHAINVLISHYNFSLNLDQLKQKEKEEATLSEEEKKLFKIEDSIVRFLDVLIAHMPTEVAKNWLKFQHFFEFWRDFAAAGEAQIAYLYKKEFVSILIDFYLGNKSPVPELSEKKHSIGNRYVDPEFNPLIQTLARLIERARVPTKSGAPPLTSAARRGLPVYDLSRNDMKCLLASDFYDKTLREKYDFPAFGLIVQHLCFENEEFSCSVAEMVLKGINRVTFDESRPYLECMSYFVSIADYLQPKRFEWIFGYPQPIVSTNRSGHDSFGVYGNNGLDDLIVSYETPLALETGTSFLNFILQNRKKAENLCINCVRQLLILLDSNYPIFQYITSLPPPTATFAKYTDWIPYFIEYFLGEAKKYTYSSYSKEEIGLEAQKLWKSVEERVNKSVGDTRKAWEQVYAKVNGTAVEENGVTEPNNGVLSYIIKPYLIGQTYKVEEIEKKLYTNQEIPNEVALACTESYCYITESKPTGKGNKAFPDYYLNESRFRSIDVTSDNPISLFIQARGPYDDGKNTMHSYVKTALNEKSSPGIKKAEKKENDEEPMNIQPIISDDVEAQTKNQRREPEAAPGSSGENVERLDESPKVEGAGSPQKVQDPNEQVIHGQVAVEDKVEVIEKDGVLEYERVVPAPEDFRFEYELNPVVRRFIFYNTTAHPVTCQIKIVPKTGDFMNFRVPVSTFKSKVKANSNACVLGLMKILPEVGWGEYEVECDIQKADVAGANNRYDNDGSGSGRKRNVQFFIRPIDTSVPIMSDEETP